MFVKSSAGFGTNCDLDRTFLGSVERGEGNVAILNLRKIAQALRVPLRDLLADREVDGGNTDD